MKRVFLAITLVWLVISMSGCGDDHSTPPPTFVSQIPSNPVFDGDIEQTAPNTFAITQGMTAGVQSVFAGIDPVALTEFRAFLDFPLGGTNGVPANAVIDSAFLDIVINSIQPTTGTIPIRIELVSFQPPTLLTTDFDRTIQPPLAFTTIAPPISLADVGRHVSIDVTQLMVEAQRLGLPHFQVRILEDSGGSGTRHPRPHRDFRSHLKPGNPGAAAASNLFLIVQEQKLQLAHDELGKEGRRRGNARYPQRLEPVVVAIDMTEGDVPRLAVLAFCRRQPRPSAEDEDVQERIPHGAIPAMDSPCGLPRREEISHRGLPLFVDENPAVLVVEGGIGEERPLGDVDLHPHKMPVHGGEAPLEESLSLGLFDERGVEPDSHLAGWGPDAVSLLTFPDDGG
ncbi:lipoprotein, putative [Geobacter metallireducens GS-15]|uniref:Lipoprotein, putative n=1 Tax=Geobacter metallireducens (strain ATCC 53774 / DSM 7210 / GS-15) TaxID=269799 RepID=J9JEP1_GEOMG|nr:lipoprotein, putative [Geobacter metallireducens GS-15]